MKNMHIDFINMIIKETGYEWEYVSDRLDEAMHQGIHPVDFFDAIVDGTI